MKRRIYRPIVPAALLCLLPLAVTAQAQTSSVPQQMNFQGRLAKPDGTPVPDTATQPVTVKVYSAVTGGSALWSQTGNVAVHNGVFAIKLDFSTGYQNGGSLGSVFSAGATPYLEIQVGSAAPLSPRQPLVSVPFAFAAQSVASGAITSSSLAPGLLNPLAWLLGGNSGTNPTTRFLGTTDNQPLVFKTNSAERLRVDTAGNVGIGTSTPSQMLTVAGGIIVDYNAQNTGSLDRNGSAGIGLSFGGSGSGEGLASARAGTGNVYGLDFYTNYYRRLSITNGGSIGINTLTPAALLDVNGTGNFSGSLTASAGVFCSSISNDRDIRTSTLITTGNVGIGTTTPGALLDVNGPVRCASLTQTSDSRFKPHVATLDNALDTILNLRGVTYEWDRANWKDRNFPEGRQVGFIAQEVEKFLPALVNTDKNGYKSVAYQNVAPVLVEAIKAQQKQIEAQRKQIEELKAQNAKVETLQAELEALAKEMKKLRRDAP